MKLKAGPPHGGVPGEAYEKLNCTANDIILIVMEVGSGTPLRVAPKKLSVVLLKTTGVAVHSAEVPGAGKLLLSAEAAKRASIGRTCFFHVTLLLLF